MAVIMCKDLVLPKRISYAEYLESSGTQYIKTGFVANQNTRVVCKARDVGSTGANVCLFGGRTSYIERGFDVWWTINTSYSMFTYGNNSNSNISEFAANSDYLFDANKNVLTANGATVATLTANTFSGWEIYLFGCNQQGTFSYASKSRIYYVQIYDNDVMVRDLWPCYDPDGIACLYDKVEKKYYYNAGSGEFIAGVAA